MTVEITQMEMPKLRRFSAKGSQYDFGSLRAGTTDCVKVDVKEGEDVKKVQSRLASAVTAYRARTETTAKFTTRIFPNSAAVGVWKLSESDEA
jgi:hypothetical protein